MTDERWGFELPVLLLAAFRTIINELHGELSRTGHPDARPAHGFALQAVGADGVSVSELGRRLGVTKQAAAKTAAGLERLGYVVRRPDPNDGRATLVHRSELGISLLTQSAQIFERLRDGWVAELGASRLRDLETALETLAGSPGPAVAQRLSDLPGWLG